nr:hypothetical protein [Tanacetum cinerariifolium]
MYGSVGYGAWLSSRHGCLVKLGHGYAASSCWPWHIEVKPVGSSSLTKLLYTAYLTGHGISIMITDMVLAGIAIEGLMNSSNSRVSIARFKAVATARVLKLLLLNHAARVLQ